MKKIIFELFIFLRKFKFFELIINKIVVLEKRYKEKQHQSIKYLYSKLNMKIPTILAGPFKGIKYYSDERALTAISKAIGTYELELVPIIKHVLKKRYDLIIDIGAAEGYYVIGFAKNYPNIKIIAYDYDPFVREELKKMVKLNNVESQVTIKEFCDEKELLALPSNINALIVSDCEGYELKLF